VTAFAVPHGSWRQAFGYRFDTRDRRIVISGDTRATDAVVDQCAGCDVLVHEVYAQAGWEQLPSEWQRYHASFHTSAVDLGRLAARAGPKLLVLYHQLPWRSTREQIVKEVREHFAGPVAYGNDLDVY
jgi:ribonuclease Z